MNPVERRALALALALLGGCRAAGDGEPAGPDGPTHNPTAGPTVGPTLGPTLGVASQVCPRPSALDDPRRRVDLALAEGAFGYCDFELYGPSEITDAGTYARVVTCAEPPGRPAIDFATTRLFVTRVRAPSVLLGATRAADGRILVHVHAPGTCSGVDWGDAVHVVALPNDGSAVELAACVEGSTCGPGVYPP